MVNRARRILGVVLVISLIGLALAGCGGGSQPLTLRITSPGGYWDADVVGGVTTTIASVYISGLVYPAKARVTINGTEVVLSGSGGFTKRFDIPYGKSTFEVIAVMKKEAVTRVVEVTRVEE